jgi:Na+/H+ antiporter NhaD/arsenite permease-like protein
MSSTEGQQNHLNGQSGFILAVFCVVSALVIWPVKIPLPAFLQRLLLSALLKTRVIGHDDLKQLSSRRLHIHLSLTTAPVIAVILLLATTTIRGSTIRLGIVGDENVKPYDVLVLFISLAYISIALDGTGALEATAFYVSKRGGSSGRLLFTYLYAFFLLTACIVGNDPLILSGTPFLAYLAQHTGLDPTAWIFAEFMAANTASAVLVSSNPTNILITGSFGLNYLTGFTKWTILPSLIPAALNYPILLGMFWNKIPKKLTPLNDDPWSKLRDKTGAFFLSGLMLVTVAVLVGTSFVPGHAVQVWMVTAPAGVTAFLYNVVTDWIQPEIGTEIVRQQSKDSPADTATLSRTWSRGSRSSGSLPSRLVPVQAADADAEKGELPVPEPSLLQSHSRSPTLPANDEEKDVPTTDDTLPASDRPLERQSPSPNVELPSNKQKSSKPAPEKATHPQRTLLSLVSTLSTRFPATTHTLTLLPIPLLPFAMAEFILVRGLSQRGWIQVFAIGFARACTSPAATVFFFGFVSAAFLCPLAGTNIGATIILVEIIRDPQFMQSPQVSGNSKILPAAIYSVAMGSNIGAFSYTFAGSLAGLLWRGLLADKGVVVSQWRFATVNLGPLLMQIVVSSAIVLGEVYWFGPS